MTLRINATQLTIIKCYYAECNIFYCYAKCHYAECRGAISDPNSCVTIKIYITAHIRHLCSKTTVSSCQRCLINTGAEKMNNILPEISVLSTRAQCYKTFLSVNYGFFVIS